MLCRLSTSIPSLCPPNASNTPSQDHQTVPRLYQRPLGRTYNPVGKHCVRLWPQPSMPAPHPYLACSHQTVFPHPDTAFSGSPLPTTKIHILSLGLEVSQHQPPACCDFPKNHLSAPAAYRRRLLEADRKRKQVSILLLVWQAGWE